MVCRDVAVRMQRGCKLTAGEALRFRAEGGKKDDQHHGVGGIGHCTAEEFFHDGFVVAQGRDGREDREDRRDGGAERTYSVRALWLDFRPAGSEWSW